MYVGVTKQFNDVYSPQPALGWLAYEQQPKPVRARKPVPSCKAYIGCMINENLLNIIPLLNSTCCA